MNTIPGSLVVNLSLGPRKDKGVFPAPVVVYMLIWVWLESVIQLNTSSSKLASWKWVPWPDAEWSVLSSFLIVVETLS